MAFTYAKNVPNVTGVSLPPQTVNAAATGAPANGGYVLPSSLKARALIAICQTGAFTSTPSCAFKLSYADDANGTNVADVTGGALATIAAAQTVSVADITPAMIAAVPSGKYIGVRCAVTGGTSAYVAAPVVAADPAYVG